MQLLRTIFLLSLLSAVTASQPPAPSLEVQFGPLGLERLSYKGQTLTDLKQWPADTFHIWHMRSTDLSGKPRTDGQYGWGETNRGRRWDFQTHTWTYLFDWGEIRVHYIVRDDSLEVEVTQKNNANSGIIFDGATVTPLVLHTGSPIETRISDNSDSPGFTSEPLREGEVAAVVPDPGRPLYSGFVSGKDAAAEMLVSGTPPDALPKLLDQPERSLKPGQTDMLKVSLRFFDKRAEAAVLAPDVFAAWVHRWPQILQWKDRRIIGTVYLASSPQGDKQRSGGYPKNPRRYFNDPSLDAQGQLAAFQARVLKRADAIVDNLRRLDAQGAITWDIEGEEYPQDTSYVCAPDQIGRVSPEMESPLAEGKYRGMKLVDAYFKTIRDAGFRVGVCVRPQRFILASDGSAQQEPVTDADALKELTRKIRYAHDRWGATIFYLDSTVEADGSTLPASVIEQAAASVPDSLLIPEESSPRMYRAAAPFKTFLFHGDLGTDEAIRSYYPRAFSANLINDVDPAKLAEHSGDLTRAARGGDILLVHAEYWQENNPRVLEIVRNARPAH
jgi:hypothetical protein